MSEEMEEAQTKDWRLIEPNYPVKIFLTVFYSLILVTGIMGNSVTIKVTQVLKRNGYLQKNVTNHMVSLACSDLLVLIIGMPVELYSAIWNPFTSASGDASCKIYNFLFEACSYATILNVATLSFERYIAICHPFRFKALREKRTSVLITFAWLVSMVVALPLLTATGTQSHTLQLPNETVHNLTFCTNMKEHWVMYRVSIFVAFLVYVIVLICVGFMCRAMILVLQKSGINRDQGAPKHESLKVKTARKQTIIFLGLIVLSLMVCWLPNQIRRLMMAAMPKSEWSDSFFLSYITLHPVADSFFYISSVLNPFLYNLSSRQFREVFMQVLRCHLTIEHINKRTVKGSNAASARSFRPLLFKSLHRGRGNQSTIAQEKAPPTFTTFQTQRDSGMDSNTQSLSLTEDVDSAVTGRTDLSSETEV
ncbi:G-protein coupled receptor 39 [Thunnus albacares]|uniref:G-protein coupled receptor 39 n=1 Tax=Thunnus albacares TaxID=8236 RepID=UPI001CF68CBC|nr:G-protein coupled receptor 39 [Thunnus albacares]